MAKGDYSRKALNSRTEKDGATLEDITRDGVSLDPSRETLCKDRADFICKCGNHHHKQIRQLILETGAFCAECTKFNQYSTRKKSLKPGDTDYGESLMREIIEKYQATLIKAYTVGMIEVSDFKKLKRDDILEFICICKKVGIKVFRGAVDQYCVCDSCSDIVRSYNCSDDGKERKLESVDEIIELLKSVNFKTHQQRYEDAKLTGYLVCNKCSVEKQLDRFHVSDGTLMSTKCYDCKNIVRTQTRHARITNGSLLDFLHTILLDAKSRTNKHNKENRNNREFDITKEYLYELWEAQKGLCCYSGKVMKWNTIITERSDDMRAHPDRITIDRIDSNKGYIKTNVALCCWAANNMKQDQSAESFKQWISCIYHAYANQS